KTIAKGNMKVEGKVVDEQGKPVIGATVLIEGTTTGSVTDVNGNFVLSVPSKDAVLVVSYIGMATGKVKAQSKLTIALKNE
ncbi:carboxypeptidase-like regulatory domain-containing protein, partial [uncultured Bacteroides sp.]